MIGVDLVPLCSVGVVVGRLVVCALVGAASCDGGSRAATTGPLAQPTVAKGPATAQASTQPAPVDLSVLRIQSGDRLVAVGDLHGDLAATRRVLVLAGVIDRNDRWVGGRTVLVQTGDQLDRGDDERAILDLLEILRDEASRAGGAVLALNGNHEIMNVLWDFRYVTDGGWRSFDGVPGLALDDPKVRELPEPNRARAAAFMPGGPYARKLAERHIAAIVGDSAFSHAGILPGSVAGLVELDRGVQSLMRGEHDRADETVAAIMNPDSPVWTRRYGGEDPGVCVPLEQALALLGAKRMVVGHTVQHGGISSDCDGKLWRIDVGLAGHYGGRPAALEIRPDGVRVIQE